MSIHVDFESWVQEVYEALLQPGDIAIDVGAHVGRHSIPLATCVFPTGKVLAFEPLPMCRDALAENVAAHHPQLRPVLSIFPYALANTSGPSEFVVATAALAYSGLRERQYDWETPLQRMPIEVKRLDDLCLHLPSLRFIKIDAEGGELDILRGAEECLRKFRPVVSFEFGNNAIGSYEITPACMARFWADLEYEVFDITGVRLSDEAFFQRTHEQRIWDYVAVPVEDKTMRERVERVLSRPLVSWFSLADSLHHAAAHIHIGVEVPPYTRFFQPIRALARMTAGFIFYLLGIVTGPQRECNRGLVCTLDTLLKDLRKLEKAWVSQQLRQRELESTLHELRAEVAQLRQQLGHGNTSAGPGRQAREPQFAKGRGSDS